MSSPIISRKIDDMTIGLNSKCPLASVVVVASVVSVVEMTIAEVTGSVCVGAGFVTAHPAMRQEVTIMLVRFINALFMFILLIVI